MAKETRKAELYRCLDPVGPRLLVWKPRGSVTTLRKTPGGILIPQASEVTAREHGLVCEILKIGDSCESHWEVGDIVLIPTYAGIPVYIHSESSDAWLIGEGDILAKVNKELWTTPE